MYRTRALALIALLSACGGARPIPQEKPTVSAITMDHHVGTYVSTPWTFATNSFVIEGKSGLVLIDTQFTPSEATRAIDEAERLTGRKTELAVVLHPNPDKFNGTATYQKRGVRVVTSAQVNALIPSVFEIRTAAFGERYAPDWPTTTPTPDVFGDHTTEIEGGHVRLRLHVLGPGCGDAHVVAEWEGEGGRHVFVGDLVGNKVHAWLELGKIDEWLARLAEIRALKPTFVYPGRGASGGPELLDAQERYLRDVARLVDAEKPTMPIPEGALERVKAQVLALYPGYRFDVFLELGLPAVWEARAPKQK